MHTHIQSYKAPYWGFISHSWALLIERILFNTLTVAGGSCFEWMSIQTQTNKQKTSRWDQNLYQKPVFHTCVSHYIQQGLLFYLHGCVNSEWFYINLNTEMSAWLLWVCLNKACLCTKVISPGVELSWVLAECVSERIMGYGVTV